MDEILLSHKKDEYPTFESTWMGLEFMQSEVSKAEKANYHMISLVEHKKYHGGH